MSFVQGLYLLAAALVGVMLFFLRSNGRQCTAGRLPPGPPGLPIIGNLLDMGQFTHRGLAKLAKLYGGFFYLRIGFANVFVVSSPDTAREILHEHDAIFPQRSSTAAMVYLSYDMADMAFAHYDAPFWRQMRKLCVMKLFSPQRNLSWRTVRSETDVLVKSLVDRRGTVANVGELVFKFSLNVTFRAAFGARGQDDEKEFEDIMKELSEILLAFNVADFIPFLGWLDLNGINKRMKTVRRALDVFIDRIIDEHIAKWKNGNVSSADLVDDMIAYLAEVPGTDTREDGVELRDLRLTRNNIKGLMMDIMLGGTETVASTLEWAMSELLRNPDELKRAQNELACVVGLDRKVEDGDLEKLPYLRCVSKEVLRIHTPSPLLLRESLEDCNVSGYVIPKKSRIWMNVWAMGRDEKHWIDAEMFRPSRFAEESAHVDFRGSEFWYLPFGSGRRSCPGMQLGMYSLELGLAQLLHCFDWSLPEGMKPSELDMDDVFGLTAPKAMRLTAVPSPRLSKQLF